MALPHKLSSKKFKSKYGEVYKNTHAARGISSGAFYSLFLLHRFFFIFTVFTGYHFGPLQAFLMVIAASFFLYYLIQWKPFLSAIDSVLTTLSTIVLIILYLFCLLFSVLSPQHFPTLRTTLGYIFIIIVLALFAINFFTILFSTLVKCIITCSKRKRRRLYPERTKRELQNL